MRSLFFLAALIAARQAATQQYFITDLGLTGYASAANAVNERGQVVGYVRATANAPPRAFLWQNGQVTYLAPWESQAIDINDRGDIVGEALDPATGQQRALFWQGLLPVFLPMPNLPYLNSSVANAVNDNGVVAGTVWHFAAQPGGGFRLTGQTTAWPNLSSYRSPNFYPFLSNMGSDIGPADQVVGHNETRSNETHAYLWQGETVTDLELGTQWSHAEAVNGQNVIVGWQQFGASVRAFRWTTQNSIDLQGLPGGQNHWAYDLNENDAIVGETEFPSGLVEPFLWQNGQCRALNSLIPAQSGWRLVTARDINNRGQIVGYGYHHNRPAAYLASPVPEPSSLVVLGGFALMLVRRRTR